MALKAYQRAATGLNAPARTKASSDEGVFDRQTTQSPHSRGLHGAPKTFFPRSVQVFATALAVYTTTLSLGGQSLVDPGLAAKYGVTVSVGGTGSATFNISNGGSSSRW
jgi:hypothetical protein